MNMVNSLTLFPSPVLTEKIGNPILRRAGMREKQVQTLCAGPAWQEDLDTCTISEGMCVILRSDLV